MSCYNCPGRAVPHRCGNTEATLKPHEQLRELVASMKKGRGSTRTMRPRVPLSRIRTTAAMTTVAPITETLGVDTHAHVPQHQTSMTIPDNSGMPLADIPVHTSVACDGVGDGNLNSFPVCLEEDRTILAKHASLCAPSNSNSKTDDGGNVDGSDTTCTQELSSEDDFHVAATNVAEETDVENVEQTSELACPPSGPVSCVASAPLQEYLCVANISPQVAAKGLFRYVAGVLNGAHHVDQVRDRVDDIVAWLGTTAVTDDSSGAGPWFWSVSAARTSCVSFSVACDALAAAIEAGAVPPAGVSVLVNLRAGLNAHGVGRGARLHLALAPSLCPRCQELPPVSTTCGRCKGSGTIQCNKCMGSGRFKVECRMCCGSGVDRRRRAPCNGCKGTGHRDQGECNRCKGGGVDASVSCDSCEMKPEAGRPRPFCEVCVIYCQRARLETQRQARERRTDHNIVPEEGVTVERCGASQLANLQSLWEERGACGKVLEAWRLDNPLCTFRFHARRDELKMELGRSPDELQGFHGTHPDNVISICKNGFDSGRRSGQVYGAGEYFAKCPDVSVGYCRGGEYMLVCRLTLGHESSSEDNRDGDHIWVPSMSYYVIAKAEQVLPQYIIKFTSSRCHYSIGQVPRSAELEKVLSTDSWTTKAAAAIARVPPNRQCQMSRPSANVLWMGLLHAHFSDDELIRDVCTFLQRHAPAHVDGLKVHIVKGHFKKAHAVLTTPMPQALVHRLNKLPFLEGGTERTICVDDAAGSPGQKCPKFIAGYCRGENLRFTHPCWCSHPQRETQGASYNREKLDLRSAKGNEITGKFVKYGSFHDGQPRVVAIHAIINKQLEKCHEAYRRYLTTKHSEEPTVRELYHGTNNNILDVLYTHGLQPPSDVSASELCPVSGGKGLCTTLCPNTCKYCTEKHEWNRCHMFGLGIYLADLAQKSHRYCSQPEVRNGKRRYRMVICSVLGRAFKVEGHLRHAKAMHDVANVRALGADDLAEMVESCCGPKCPKGNAEEVAEKSDMLFVQGLGSRCRPGFSVFNSEYIAFHPHQCLPKYEITYEMD